MTCGHRLETLGLRLLSLDAVTTYIKMDRAHIRASSASIYTRLFSRSSLLVHECRCILLGSISKGDSMTCIRTTSVTEIFCEGICLTCYDEMLNVASIG